MTLGRVHLTPAEFRVVSLVAEGLKNREISDKVGTTVFVVKNQLREIYWKVSSENRVMLALWMLIAKSMAL